MANLTDPQTLDMLADLAAGNLGDVFSQEELQQLFDRAGNDYNTAIYYGWRQLLGNSAAWVDYKVAQTSVSRGQAFDHIKAMLEFWRNETLVAGNQLISAGIAPVPTRFKPRPYDDHRPIHGRNRNSSHANWRDW